MSTSPVSCKFPSLIDDLSNGFLYICAYGTRGSALGFRGDESFIERWFNWAKNRGVISDLGKLIRPYPGQSIAYIIAYDDANDTEMSNGVNKIIAGLTAQFRSEIIMNGEIKPLCECFSEEEGWSAEFDEETIGKLARERAQDFYQNHISREDFLKRYDEAVAPIYEVTGNRTGEGSGWDE